MSGFPENRGWPPGKSGKLPEKSGEFWGKPGKLLGNLWIAVKLDSQRPCPSFPQGKKKHININKFAGLSRDWVGAKIYFMCFISGHSLWGRKNT